MPLLTLLLVGAGVELILIWLILWPSRVYRASRGWLRTHAANRYDGWLKYTHLRCLYTPQHLLRNAVKLPDFNQDDLRTLSSLFAKLDQPAALEILPGAGAKFEPDRMESSHEAQATSYDYVLKPVRLGVEWRGEVLRKAVVEAGSSDRLMLYRISEAPHGKYEQAEKFLEHLFPEPRKGREEIPCDFVLSAALTQGFIDRCLIQSQVGEFFEMLRENHPEGDFQLILPEPESEYDATRMRPRGGDVAGQICRVESISCPGLERTRDKNWRIKAIVKVKNLSGK